MRKAETRPDRRCVPSLTDTCLSKWSGQSSAHTSTGSGRAQDKSELNSAQAFFRTAIGAAQVPPEGITTRVAAISVGTCSRVAG